MTIINNNNVNKKLTNSIFAISKEAKERKSKDNDVINSTVGMFFDEANKLKVFDSVNDLFSSMSLEDSLSYLTTSGGDRFNTNVQKWVFGESYDELANSLYVASIATPGGTGALFLSLKNYLENGDTVLVPNHRWSNYDKIIEESGLKIGTYNLYQGSIFDFDSFKKSCLDTISKQNKLYVIINDPCHNPTGFCLKENDYDNIISLLNVISKEKEVILMLDIAYIDYSENRGNVVRKYFKKFKCINPNFMVHFSFSASKSFGLYGLRTGALVSLTSDEKEKEYFLNSLEVSSRATWSNCSHLGANIVNELVNNEKYTLKFNDELKEACNMLHDRANAFLEACKKYDVITSPYSYGFFVNIEVADANDVYLKLRNKGIYVIPLKGSIRIALSSVNIDECDRLAYIISNVLRG